MQVHAHMGNVIRVGLVTIHVVVLQMTVNENLKSGFGLRRSAVKNMTDRFNAAVNTKGADQRVDFPQVFALKALNLFSIQQSNSQNTRLLLPCLK